MSAIYENENNEVCVCLYEKDYVLVMSQDRKTILKIVSKDGKLVVETLEKGIN